MIPDWKKARPIRFGYLIQGFDPLDSDTSVLAFVRRLGYSAAGITHNNTMDWQRMRLSIYFYLPV